jgi:hypothetical protein
MYDKLVSTADRTKVPVSTLVRHIIQRALSRQPS